MKTTPKIARGLQLNQHHISVAVTLGQGNFSAGVRKALDWAEVLDRGCRGELKGAADADALMHLASRAGDAALVAADALFGRPWRGDERFSELSQAFRVIDDWLGAIAVQGFMAKLQAGPPMPGEEML